MQAREESLFDLPARPAGAGRRRRFVAAAALAAAAVGPCLLFSEVLLGSIGEFRLEFAYLVASWTAWVCLLGALAFFVPVVVSVGRDPYSRWYMRPGLRHGYEAWGLSLYLLGILLATQMSQAFSLV